jgi:deazaflavin-dependent oxidoreductase (nitroreductase family)
LVDAQFCYLTTTGRRTGRPHTIEIWFAAAGGTLYLGGSERSDWVRNLLADRSVAVRIEGEDLGATARPVEAGTDEDALGRRLLLEKYQSRGSRDLESWGRTAFLVAIDLGD